MTSLHPPAVPLIRRLEYRGLCTQIPSPLGIPDFRHSSPYLEHAEEPVAQFIRCQRRNGYPHLPVDRKPGTIGKTGELNLTGGTFPRCPVWRSIKLEAQGAKGERCSVEFERSLEPSGLARALG